MKYTISYSNPLTHLVAIEIFIPVIETEYLDLQLPAWRPGRYELQNYAANIKGFQAFDPQERALSFYKTSRNCWRIENKKKSSVKIRYQYYAYQMDAGGCWLDEKQLYLNFICCLMYEPFRINEACTVTLLLPAEYKIACGLPKENHVLKAENFYHLVDSPMIASASLTHFSFVCNNIPFHIWIQGENYVSEEKIKQDFFQYTEAQLQLMEDFPEKEYHYLFQFLPYRHYHGVEHRNSTVITLGPSEAIPEKGYSDLIGISSHELFHAWNIIKIRPKEMMPYDFTKENYFTTGFVAEGFTTYYGDLFLVRSGVISMDEYFAELTMSLKRHFDHFGNYHLSLAESSIDLWVDGYSAGIPDRKVSIYVKGCIVALLLDLEIRSQTHHTKSLDDLMRMLWNEFGKKAIGYSFLDIIRLTEEITGASLRDFFEECVLGRTDLKQRLSKALKIVGCELSENKSEKINERDYGFRTQVKNHRLLVESIAPESPASYVLSKDDEIVAINGQPLPADLDQWFPELDMITLTVNRWGRVVEATIATKKEISYFPVYTIVRNPNASKEETEAFKKWLFL